MKLANNLLLLTAMGTSGASLAADNTLKPSKPNIIFFMVDDMGWQDCSLPMWRDSTFLNQLFHTPNLERLAKQGTTFTHAYASAVSSPTRVSLMTGMNPTSHRVSNWTLHQEKSTDAPSEVLNFPAWNWNGLQPVGSKVPQSIEATTLPKLLRDAGYRTIHVGKAHFGSIGTPGEDPVNLGFDVNVAGHAAGGLASYLGEKNFGNKPETNIQTPFAVPGLEEYWGKDIFITEALTQRAIKELDKARGTEKPFFLYMSHYAIHVPLDKDSRFYQKYIDRGLSPQWARYAALVEGMDKSLGDIMDYVDSTNIANNTIIIFMSDNGGLSAVGREPHQTYGNKHNYPLNSGKGSAYEGGVRVPLVISAPGVSSEQSRNHSTVEVCDMMPTILSLAGVSRYKTIQKLDGIDITHNIMGGRNTRDRTLYWHFPCKWDAEGPGIGTYSSIIRGPWKLIYYYNTGKTEMYNIREDIFEIVNQGNNPSLAELRKKLANDLTAYLKSKKAQLPSLKSGEWCHYPNGDKYHHED